MSFYSIGNIMGGGGLVVPGTDTDLITRARLQTAQAAAVQAPTLIAPSQMSPMPSQTDAPVLMPGGGTPPMTAFHQMQPVQPGMGPSTADPSVTVAAPAPQTQAKAPLQPYPGALAPSGARGFWLRQSPVRKMLLVGGVVGAGVLLLRLVR